MLTKVGNVHLEGEELFDAAVDGRIVMNVGFGPNVSVTELRYCDNPDDSTNDRKFAMGTYRTILRHLTDGSLKLVHYGATVYHVRPRAWRS